MFVAYNKDKKKIHINNTNQNEKYYCLTCGEELCIKKGNIKVHHFSHKSKTNCDNWHYDMSEWHSSWQNQFPIENQEVIFEYNGKKHRADVFINNTVIEFQHSPLNYEEFDDRNTFYTSLGYKVIWIFDAKESYGNGEFEEVYSTKNEYYWKNQYKVFRGLKTIDNNIDIYLQEYNNIWKDLPKYKDIDINIYDIKECGYLHHIDWCNGNGLEYFISNNDNMVLDFEFVDKYNPVMFLHKKGIGSEDLMLLKNNFTLNDISDSLNSNKDVMYNNFKYLWCPAVEKYVYSGDACHACIHLSQNNDRCKYRFENLLSKKFDKVLNIGYSNEGKVKNVTILKDGKKYKVKYDDIPTEVFTLKEVFQVFPQSNLIGTKNIKSGWCVLLTKYNYNRMLKYGECYGRIRLPENINRTYSKSESQIFNWNKKEWIITWVK